MVMALSAALKVGQCVRVMKSTHARPVVPTTRSARFPSAPPRISPSPTAISQRLAPQRHASRGHDRRGPHRRPPGAAVVALEEREGRAACCRSAANPKGPKRWRGCLDRWASGQGLGHLVDHDDGRGDGEDQPPAARSASDGPGLAQRREIEGVEQATSMVAKGAPRGEPWGSACGSARRGHSAGP